MAYPMTLRDAARYATSQGFGISEMRSERYARALAIIDAAVEAHEARIEASAAFERRPRDMSLASVRDYMRRHFDRSHAADRKLRSLERGEEAGRG